MTYHDSSNSSWGILNRNNKPSSWSRIITMLHYLLSEGSSPDLNGLCMNDLLNTLLMFSSNAITIYPSISLYQTPRAKVPFPLIETLQALQSKVLKHFFVLISQVFGVWSSSCWLIVIVIEIPRICGPAQMRYDWARISSLPYSVPVGTCKPRVWLDSVCTALYVT